MIKGVNKQVVEITRPNCDYFERVIFFVKPEFSSVSQGTLRERANIMANAAGSPPATKIRKRRISSLIRIGFWLAAGVGVGMILSKIF